MSATTTERSIARELATRILNEGYGAGAWHGPDLKAALADVTPETAFQRPAAGRHNIAEIAIHHAYCARGVRAKLTGVAAEPFVLNGDDWFALTDPSTLSWETILGVVEREQQRLTDRVAEIADGRAQSPLPAAEQLALILGITCHAVYHAGQVQLVKTLNGRT
jgi:hypothetical protein